MLKIRYSRDLQKSREYRKIMGPLYRDAFERLLYGHFHSCAVRMSGLLDIKVWCSHFHGSRT